MFRNLAFLLPMLFQALDNVPQRLFAFRLRHVLISRMLLLLQKGLRFPIHDLPFLLMLQYLLLSFLRHVHAAILCLLFLSFCSFFQVFILYYLVVHFLRLFEQLYLSFNDHFSRKLLHDIVDILFLGYSLVHLKGKLVERTFLVDLLKNLDDELVECDDGYFLGLPADEVGAVDLPAGSEVLPAGQILGSAVLLLLLDGCGKGEQPAENELLDHLDLLDSAQVEEAV